MGARLSLLTRQFVLVAGAALAYFGVRGLTEGNVARADLNAERVLRLEHRLGIDVERGLQRLLFDADVLITLANWVYIWLHWPVVIGTLAWLLFRHRGDYDELRNAMFISGAIGLVIFATFPVTPPRLLGLEYIDTVTEQSHSYRVLQPPALVNKYAAVPSLHFGWNLLIGMAWASVGRTRPWRIAGLVMPIAMGWAVVATANHWVLDVVVGGAVALIGLSIERIRRRAVVDRGIRHGRPALAATGGSPGPTDEPAGGHPRLTSAAAHLVGPPRVRNGRRRPALALPRSVRGIGRAAERSARASPSPRAHDRDPHG